MFDVGSVRKRMDRDFLTHWFFLKNDGFTGSSGEIYDQIERAVCAKG